MVEIFNKFGVSIHGDNIALLLPLRGEMARDEALQLAAWIVAVADPSGKYFQEILSKVQES